jgi:catechol 2,3-dioxygenase-like lactoylglutathione lyase family enzyme
VGCFRAASGCIRLVVGTAFGALPVTNPIKMQLDRLDHLVLTVADVEATCHFYHDVLGMDIITFDHGRKALQFGRQKINVNGRSGGNGLVAKHPSPGSADLCFITEASITDVLAELKGKMVPIVEGVVPRTGALGPMSSIYLRDPDENLVEISAYPK